VHTLAAQLAPILAAEKSKVPFYIAGGVLVAWALLVSLGLGLRKPGFPGNLGGQRIVSAITAVLVLAALSTAVITAGGEAKAGGESKPTYTQYGEDLPDTAAPESANATPSASAESTAAGESTAASTTEPSTPAQTTAAPATPAKRESPKATTGTPAPPSSPAAAGASTLKLAANPAGQLSYTTKQLSAKAGNVTIDFTNASPVEHDVAIARDNTVLGQTPVFTGGSKKLTLNLKPGTYTFYCTVPGHRAAGMEGTLKVS
jgi:plastocyanin